jgi:hypothetical protein
MPIDMNNKRLLELDGFIKILKLISVGVGVFAIAGIAICPLASNKPVDKVKEKTEKSTSVLPPANYTIFMGKQDNEVVIKFHKQASELHLKNISTEESNCLLNGGGLNCVLATAYQPKSEATEKQVKTTPKDEFKRQSYKIPDIEISSDMMENIMVVGGVVLGILLISRLRSK